MIWFGSIPALEEMNKRNAKSLATHMNIACEKVGSDFLEGKMIVSAEHMQPNGIMNGGASCVFAETIASTAANYCIDQSKYIAVGTTISTSHIKPAKKGDILKAIARPRHLGKRSQVWVIEIINQHDKIISITQLTLAIIEKSSEAK